MSCCYTTAPIKSGPKNKQRREILSVGRDLTTVYLVINFVQTEEYPEVECIWTHGKQRKTELLVTVLERGRWEMIRMSREESSQ